MKISHILFLFAFAALASCAGNTTEEAHGHSHEPGTEAHSHEGTDAHRHSHDGEAHSHDGGHAQEEFTVGQDSTSGDSVPHSHREGSHQHQH